MADDIAGLRDRVEKAKLEAELRQLEKVSKTPWWRSAGIVTGVTAMIAAVLPVTTAVEEHYRRSRELAVADAQKQRELALQEARLEHEIRTSYLDRLDHDGSRLRTLRFLIKTAAKDSVLQEWATEERAIIEGKLAQYSADLEALKQELINTTDPAQRKLLQEQIDALEVLMKSTALVEPATVAQPPM